MTGPKTGGHAIMRSASRDCTLINYRCSPATPGVEAGSPCIYVAVQDLYMTAVVYRTERNIFSPPRLAEAVEDVKMLQYI